MIICHDIEPEYYQDQAYETYPCVFRNCKFFLQHAGSWGEKWGEEAAYTIAINDYKEPWIENCITIIPFDGDAEETYELTDEQRKDMYHAIDE